MIPTWLHVTIVLAQLLMHGLTVYWASQRIQSLKAALVARRALLSEDDDTVTARGVSFHSMAAGDTLSLRAIPGSRVDIMTSSATTLRVSM